MRNCRLVGLEGVAVLRFVGHHFIAVWTKDRQGTFSSATTATAAAAATAAPVATAATTAATAATAVLGHGREKVGVLFHDEIKLLPLGFDPHIEGPLGW